MDFTNFLIQIYKYLQILYQAGQDLVGEDELAGVGSNVSVLIESHQLDMKHVNDFAFIHGKSYLESQLRL